LRIVSENVDQDDDSPSYEPRSERPELHFTNCLFTESTEYIRAAVRPRAGCDRSWRR
jgi:hypothetical protein